MTTQLSAVATLFQDDFANPGKLDDGKWEINKWQAKDNPSFLGKTTIRQDLPLADNGIARLKLETYYTDQYNAAGNIFLGDEAITKDSYTTANGGIAFEGRLKFDSTQGGMIAGFFSFQRFKYGDARNPHDEIDVVEILTTNLAKLSTNVFLASTEKDYPASMPMVGKFSDWHTYRAEWLPGMVRWFVDGVLVRTDTEHVPVQPQQLHMNLWGVPTDWKESKGDSLGPTVGTSGFVPSANPAGPSYVFDVSQVRVYQLSTKVGDDNPNTIDGTANGDGLEGRGGNDTLNGLAGDDTLFGGSGNDAINGGEGNDTSVYQKDRSNYDVTFADGVLTVADRTGTDGTDTLTSIEFVNFKDALYEVVGGTTTATPANYDRIGDTIWVNRPPSNYPNAYVQEQYAVGSNGVLTPVVRSETPLAAASELVVHDDGYTIVQGRSLAAPSVLTNDSSGSPTAISLVTGTSHGTLSLGGDGSFTYVPNAGFRGADSFVYRATDASGQSGDAVAFIDVVPVTAATTLDVASLSPSELAGAMYAGFLGRGADLGGFIYWAIDQQTAHRDRGDVLGSFHQMANNFAGSAEAKAIYPLLAHPATASDAEISSFVSSIFNNLFARPVDAAGNAYWSGQVKQAIAAGQPLGSVVANIIGGAQDSGGNGDITALANKVLLSLEFVDTQFQYGTQWTAQDQADAAAMMRSVTADQASLVMGIKQAHDLLIPDVA